MSSVDNRLELKIFFDESGKKENKPTMMGGLCIPTNVYNNESIQQLTPLIKGKDLSWKRYRGDSHENARIQAILFALVKYEQVLKMNVINYDSSKIEEHAKDFKHIREDLSDFTIYTKFPERIVYGLLRKFGQHASLTADLIIEEAEEYKKYDLNTRMREQLNVQSIYRCENFQINSSVFETKGKEIGLEATDLLLGIMRTIIHNKCRTTASGRDKRRIAFVMKLLNNPHFYRFLSGIKYYEWTHSTELKAIDFSSYLQLFVAKNYDQFHFE